MIKFGLSEKHTKFEKNIPHGFDKSADLLSKRQKHEEDFFKLCALLRKSELYQAEWMGLNFYDFCGFQQGSTDRKLFWPIPKVFNI